MPIPKSEVNSTRSDLYKNFKFLVIWDEKHVAGFSKVSGIASSTEVAAHRETGEADRRLRRMPGQSMYQSIMLERGVTYDTDFELWCQKVWEHSDITQDNSSLSTVNEDFRKDIVLHLFDEAGQLVFAYNIHRCRVSKYEAMREFDDTGSAVAIQTLTLENEGWERVAAASQSIDPNFQPQKQDES